MILNVTLHMIECDWCGNSIREYAWDMRAARVITYRHGWAEVNGEIICKDCGE